MSRWNDAFESHPVNQSLEQAQAALDRKELAKLEPAQEQEIVRLRKCVELLARSLASADHELYQLGLLKQLNNNLNAIEQGVTNFISDKNIDHLTGANNAADTILNLLPTIMLTSSELSGVVSLESMIDRGNRHLSHLERTREEFEQRIAKLKESAAGLGTRLDDLNTRIDEKLSALDQLSNDWVQQFNESQNERGERFENSLNRIEQSANEKTTTIVDDLQRTLSELRQSFTQKVDEIENDAKERHKEIRTLHGLIAQDSITGGHKSSADKEAVAADRWRRASIFFALAAVGWLIFVFWETGHVNWQASMAGFPVTLVLLSAAGYAAHQSAQHRRQSNRQRQFALEMIAIDPFLETLGEEERKRIKETLAAQYFGHVFDDKHAQPDEGYQLVPSNMVQRFMDIIARSQG